MLEFVRVILFPPSCFLLAIARLVVAKESRKYADGERKGEEEKEERRRTQSSREEAKYNTNDVR